MRFHVLPDESLENDVTYAIALETTSGLFTIDGDLLKLNEESFLPDEIGKQHYFPLLLGLV